MRSVPLVLAVMLITAVTAARAWQNDSATPAGRRFALLVGVTDFIAPAMKKYSLEGPANDVALFRTLLTGDRFQLADAAIVTLAGLPADAALRPTRANIEREFRRLSDRVSAGDHVLVLLAGHGSQQPANPDPMDVEPDGLDEIFLPADATGWDEGSNTMANAIVDDDLHQWLEAIRNKGAIVTIIVDACHSGTVTRGGPSAWKDRGIPVESLIPAAALANARAAAATRAAGRSMSATFDLADRPGDIAALYAADMTQTTPELRMPDRNGPVHGLFTYTLTRVLTETPAPLTYRELIQRVLDRYRAEAFDPTPSLEGAAADRVLLGDRLPRARPTFAVETRQTATNWLLEAGSIHGLTSGSVLELLAGGQPAGPPIGYVRVRDVNPTTSVVAPIAFAGLPPPRAARVDAGVRARLNHHEFGSLRLRIALQQEVSGTLAVVPPGAGPATIERALRSLPARSAALVQRVSSTDADWFVRAVGGRVTLVSARAREDRAQPLVDQPGKQFDVAPVGDSALADKIGEYLERIARAANLSRLASYVDPEASLQIKVMRYPAGTANAVPFPSDTGDAAVADGDRLQFTIRNTGSVPLDVTVLYVDANFGVIPLFPETDTALDNRIDAGRERVLRTEEIAADPSGWESLVAIGVEDTPRHENFLMLAQDALPESRSVAGAPSSPLRQLLESAVFGTRSATSATTDDRGRFAITQTWFHVKADR